MCLYDFPIMIQCMTTRESAMGIHIWIINRHNQVTPVYGGDYVAARTPSPAPPPPTPVAAITSE